MTKPITITRSRENADDALATFIESVELVMSAEMARTPKHLQDSVRRTYYDPFISVVEAVKENWLKQCEDDERETI